MAHNGEKATLEKALEVAVQTLAGAMRPEGYWEGRLSSSALSTATAITALVLGGQKEDATRIRRGVAWLGATQNADGGWGDTADSPSNLATTMLVTAALYVAEEGVPADVLGKAEAYLTTHAGTSPEARAAAIQRLYGKDKTFSVPILTDCALAGLTPWGCLPALPFELAALPQDWYRWLRLPVVSYALPALIAIGLAIHHHHPPRNPLTRWVRKRVRALVLRRLESIQPESGGFLEAVPLTAFVAMSLASLFGPNQPVVQRGLAFLRGSARPDGSWPIDSNLSVWLTTSAVTALAQAGRLDAVDAGRVGEWIARCQCQRVHPYTQAAPGGWAWTHLSGGVPDADDTSGAVVALAHLGRHTPIPTAVCWLLQLQNADGGWPTFCRGWGHLPFDKSAPDITAHALRALRAASRVGGFSPRERARQRAAIRRGHTYLQRVQRPDGAWIPLWFGNQQAPAQENPVVGTARVLMALAETDRDGHSATQGIRFLVNAQSDEGAWGGDRGVPPSVEETALAVSALAHWPDRAEAAAAAQRGGAYLARRVQSGDWTCAAPIGLYFARLWYSEALYPVIWTVEALGKLVRATAVSRF